MKAKHKKVKHVNIIRPEIDVEYYGIRGLSKFVLFASFHLIKIYRIFPSIWGKEIAIMYYIAIPKYILHRSKEKLKTEVKEKNEN